MTRRFAAIALLWLATLLVGLWPLAGMAIEVTAAPRLEISERASWCASDPDMDIAKVSAGACAFKPATMTDLARGFSADAYWLRLDLHNPGTSEVLRWLRVGHPRLEQVSLFEMAQDGNWRRTDTGIDVPRSRRPVIATNPVLPLTLKADENKTVYLRVASQSSIDLTLTLWTQDAYVATHHSVDIVLILSYGALLAAVFFTLTVYLRWRDRTYLYFGASLLSEILLNASFTGLLPIYFWPADLPFDTRLTVVAGGCTMLFFALFAHQFVGDMARYRRYYLVLSSFTMALILAVLWACLAHLSEGIRSMYPLIIAVELSGIALFFRAWRDGSRAAGFLMASYVLLVLSMAYRLTVAFGGSTFSDMNSVGYSWRFVLITPIILAAIMQRSEKLREAARQAAARVEFLAQMSHEFRTPLNVMLGYAELLERNSKRITVQEGATSIKHSGRYLLGMIDEILDHARGEAGKLTLTMTPVRWASFIEALQQGTTMMLHPRGNRFELKQEGCMPEALLLDERRFRQVLDILLTNANRYTQHGAITLTCSAASVNKQRSRLAFSVSDTGAGIAPQELEHIFHPFMRGTAGKSSGIDGSGVGLAIAQQLVTLMGGEIGVESHPGMGSRFYFTIECELAEAETQAALKPWHGKLSNPCTVLVVDNDPENCKLLSMLLADCGFSVITGESGNAARQFFGQQVDLLVTDQFMPDGDGWSVLRDWAARQVPVILLSAAPPQYPHDFPPDLRFAAIQLKPVNADALLGEISKTLALQWTPAGCPLPPDDAKRPPLELLAPLRAMIEEGAVTDIAEWLEVFAVRHPKYRAYSAKIAARNLALDFDALRSLSGAGSA